MDVAAIPATKFEYAFPATVVTMYCGRGVNDAVLVGDGTGTRVPGDVDAVGEIVRLGDDVRAGVPVAIGLSLRTRFEYCSEMNTLPSESNAIPEAPPKDVWVARTPSTTLYDRPSSSPATSEMIPVAALMTRTFLDASQTHTFPRGSTAITTGLMWESTAKNPSPFTASEYHCTSGLGVVPANVEIMPVDKRTARMREFS